MSKIQIQLSDGRNINLDLYEDVAPITVKNFKKLIKENFFDGLCFHRTIKDFMIQGGNRRGGRGNTDVWRLVRL